MSYLSRRMREEGFWPRPAPRDGRVSNAVAAGELMWLAGLHLTPWQERELVRVDFERWSR